MDKSASIRREIEVPFRSGPVAGNSRDKATWSGLLCSKVSDVVYALPNPAYYVFKYSGTAFTCGLALFSRAVAICDASPLRNPADTSSLGNFSKWIPVPINPNSLRNRTHALQTTRNGQFVRVGIEDDGGFHPVQEKKGKNNRSLYKFKLRDHRDNLLKRATNKDGSPCPPSEPGTGKCKGRAELSNCFPPSLAGVSEKEAEFIRVSKATLNDCSGVIKNGGNARITMEVQFPRLGPAIIFQLHSLPDRWLYKSPDDPNTTYRLPPSTSAETYNSMVDNGMRFEQGGYPPLTLAIEKDNGKQTIPCSVRNFLAVTCDSLRTRPYLIRQSAVIMNGISLTFSPNQSLQIWIG